MTDRLKEAADIIREATMAGTFDPELAHLLSWYDNERKNLIEEIERASNRYERSGRNPSDPILQYRLDTIMDIAELCRETKRMASERAKEWELEKAGKRPRKSRASCRRLRLPNV